MLVIYILGLGINVMLLRGRHNFKIFEYSSDLPACRI